jgi:hypothetical protein
MMDVNESKETIKKRRFIDWITRKTQKVSSSLKPIRMGTKPVPKASSYTRKSRKSIVPDFDEPMSWVPNRVPETPKFTRSSIKSSKTEKECDMMSLIPAQKTPCSYMGNLTINAFLHSYLTKTPDNRGWILDLSTGKSTVGIVMGKKNCDSIRKNLKKLIPFIECDIVHKIHMVILYGHEFRKRHLPIIDFVFKVFPSVNEIHFGLSDDFVLTPKIKNEYEKKEITLHIKKEGFNKNYLVVTK